jgi:ribosome assembly protein YihI (activator of Der GTPase)
MAFLDRNGAYEVKPEPSKSEDIVKNEPMEEGNDDSELTVKAELDEVMNDADLDAELDALDAAQGAVKAEDYTA